MDKRLEDVKKRYEAGEIKTQRLESAIFKEIYAADPNAVKDACNDAATIRCLCLEDRAGVRLDSIRNARVDNCSLAPDGRVLSGIESKIGGAIVPMGIAGPVRINGQYVKNEEIHLPLATNEAALVAGVQRGAKALNLAGGLKAIVHFDGMSRAPVIEAPDIAEARKLVERVESDAAWVDSLNRYIKDPFVRLTHIEPYQLGAKVFLRLVCKTGDAMGMNGVTKAAADITRGLLSGLPGWKLVTISSNMCADKKAAHVNVLNGRGKSAQTEAFLSDEVLSRVFKKGVNGRSLEKIVFNKCYLGSALSGTIGGFNVNAANTIAAFFAATGQDLAHVVSSSACFVQADAVDGGVHFTVSLPGLELATIGGGTLFGTAREALELIGCAGFGKSVDEHEHVMRLAEICAAAVTALELNTACAQAAGYEMADSHVKLARGEEEK
ncbi:MAG: 3-hydroxy-3-methylglutaryl-CoA reductase [Planctomycetota bacterium]|jgi:hydroxymethylglutaryl-CoA reductase (NADPH)|nr:3-hydroxy-3-methylglutaryl-CoA reductase [Planctomycetota bacterium]